MLRVFQFAKIQCSSLKYTSADADIFHHTPIVVDLTILLSFSDAHYHLMSRTNNKRFLFRDGAMKTELVSSLRRAAEFCGVYLKDIVEYSETDMTEYRIGDFGIITEL